ncbi:MAG: hypothetical protein R3E08_08500 [Thiotrichaceae bacterium]
MTWDLAAILVILIAISLVIWLYDVIFLLPHRNVLKARLTSEQRRRKFLRQLARPC